MAVQFAKKSVSTLDVLQEIGSGAQRCHDPELLEVSRLEKLLAVVLPGLVGFIACRPCFQARCEELGVPTGPLQSGSESSQVATNLHRVSKWK